jgi:hypothetical protein
MWDDELPDDEFGLFGDLPWEEKDQFAPLTEEEVEKRRKEFLEQFKQDKDK